MSREVKQEMLEAAYPAFKPSPERYTIIPDMTFADYDVDVYSISSTDDVYDCGSHESDSSVEYGTSPPSNGGDLTTVPDVDGSDDGKVGNSSKPDEAVGTSLSEQENTVVILEKTHTSRDASSINSVISDVDPLTLCEAVLGGSSDLIQPATKHIPIVEKAKQADSDTSTHGNTVIDRMTPASEHRGGAKAIPQKQKAGRSAGTHITDVLDREITGVSKLSDKYHEAEVSPSRPEVESSPSEHTTHVIDRATAEAAMTLDMKHEVVTERPNAGPFPGVPMIDVIGGAPVINTKQDIEQLPESISGKSSIISGSAVLVPF